MRITRLRLQDIRRHRELELRPAPGLTVVRGPNESGKSTIQQALELVLFRRATTTAAEFAEVRSWDAAGDPLIELDLELDGRSGLLVKRFAGTKGQVRLDLDGVVESDPSRVDQLLAEAIGIPSEKFFRSTASVRHFEMEALDRDERALRDRLQASIGGGDVGASTARKRLDEQIRRIRAAGAKNPGPLALARSEIARLTGELRAGEAALARLSADRAALAAATVARASLEEEVRAATSTLHEAEAAVKLEAQRRTLDQRYDHHQRAVDLAERLAAAEAAPPTSIPVGSLRPAVDRLRTLDAVADQLARDLAAADGVLAAARSEAATTTAEQGPGGEAEREAFRMPPAAPATTIESTPTPAPSTAPPAARVPRVAAAVLGLLAAAALVIGLLVPATTTAAVVLAAALGLLAGGAWIVARRSAGRQADRTAAREAAAQERRQRAEAQAVEAARAEVAARELAAAQAARDALLRDTVARAERSSAELEARRTTTRTEAAALMARLGVSDLPEAEAALAAAEHHAALVDGLRAELRGLLGEAPSDLDTLRAARAEAAASAAMGRHALEGMGATGTDPESARLRAQAALRGARQRLDAAIEEQGRAQGRVSQNTVDAEQVAGIAERLAAREEELVVLERRVRVYEQTLEAIIAAEAATMQKAARYLERSMGADIARITGGRYDRVRVDEHDLTITVWSPERGAWCDATQLSKGTADQLYLAARLGLVRQVTQDRRPPLVFDDPFVTFDDDRAVRAIELLRELAADHQILYLTCSDRYDTVADAVIELPAPPAVEALAGPLATT